MVGAGVVALVLVSLVVPMSLGWATPNVPRATVLSKVAIPGAAQAEAKLVSAADFARAFPKGPTRSGNVWVVVVTASACTEEGCTPASDGGLIVDDRVSAVQQLSRHTRAPASMWMALVDQFDGLKDRVAPVWWVLPPPAAGSWILLGVLLSALAALMVRPRRSGQSPSSRPLTSTLV